MATGQYVELVVAGHTDPAPGQSKSLKNVFHYQRTSEVNPINYTNVATAFKDSIKVAWSAAMSVKYVEDEVTCRPLEDSTVPPAIITGIDLNGTVTGDCHPPNIHAIMRLNYPYRGKGQRGYKRLSCVPESGTTIYKLTGGQTTLYNALGTSIGDGFTDSDGNDWVPVVFSPTRSINYPSSSATIAATPISSITVEPNVGRLKRREVTPNT